MFGFVKRIFVSAMIFFGCNLSSVNLLSCVPIDNQECKVRQKIVNVIVTSLYFLLLVLKQVNTVVVVTILMIPMQNCVFLMLLKI